MKVHFSMLSPLCSSSTHPGVKSVVLESQWATHFVCFFSDPITLAPKANWVVSNLFQTSKASYLSFFSFIPKLMETQYLSNMHALLLMQGMNRQHEEVSLQPFATLSDEKLKGWKEKSQFRRAFSPKPTSLEETFPFWVWRAPILLQVNSYIRIQVDCVCGSFPFPEDEVGPKEAFRVVVVTIHELTFSSSSKS